MEIGGGSGTGAGKRNGGYTGRMEIVGGNGNGVEKGNESYYWQDEDRLRSWQSCWRGGCGDGVGGREGLLLTGWGEGEDVAMPAMGVEMRIGIITGRMKIG